MYVVSFIFIKLDTLGPVILKPDVKSDILYFTLK